MKYKLLIIFYLHVIFAHGQSSSVIVHANAHVGIQRMASLPMPLLRATQLLPQKRAWFPWPMICGARPEEQHILSRGTPVMYGDEFIQTNLNARFQNGFIKSYFTYTKHSEYDYSQIELFTL